MGWECERYKSFGFFYAVMRRKTPIPDIPEMRSYPVDNPKEIVQDLRFWGFKATNQPSNIGNGIYYKIFRVSTNGHELGYVDYMAKDITVIGPLNELDNYAKCLEKRYIMPEENPIS